VKAGGARPRVAASATAGPAEPGDTGMLAYPVRCALLVAIGVVALWLRLVPLALPGLDAETQDLFRYDDAGGRAHVYLGDYDSYVWLRAARNYLRHGTTCDQVVDGVCRDTLTHAPVGREMRYGRSMHIVAIVGLHRLITSVRPAHPLPATAYLVPVILGVLIILPAFGIGRRVGGDVAGLATSAAIAWNPFLLTRSAGSDNDVWNVFLPVCLVWAIVRALTATTLARACTWSAVAAGFVGLHAGTWGGWPLTYGVVLVGLLGHVVVVGLHPLVRPDGTSASRRAWEVMRGPVAITAVYYVGCFVTTSIAGSDQSYFAVPAAMLRKLGPALAFAASSAAATADRLPWPSVFEGVAELYEPRRAEIGSGLGGEVARTVGWFGFALLLLPWRKWRWWHMLVATVGTGVIVRLLFGAELSRIATAQLLVVPALAAVIVRVLIDDRGGDRSYNGGAAMVATAWFLVGVVQASIGARFVLLLVAPFGIAFGHAIGRLQCVLALVPGMMGRWARPVAAVAALAILFPTLQLTHALASHYRPRIDDAWWQTLTNIRAQSPPDTVLNVWWDHGYWAKYVAERRVSADGGSLRTRIPYWTGRSLMAADERETVGLLRMLNCGSAATPEPEGRKSAYSHLVAYGVAPVDAHELVLALAVRDRASAIALLEERALPLAAQRDVLAASHCAPPPTLLVLSSRQVVLKSWKELARWQPASAGASALPAWRRDLLVADWIDCAVADDGHWRCPVQRRRRARPTWLRQVALTPGDPSSVRLTLQRPKHPGSDLVAAPTLVVQATADGRTETRTAGEPPAEVAVLIDEPNQRVLVGAHDLIRSTFVHLLFLEGRYARHLRKVDDRPGVAGVRVVTWQVDWGGGS